MSGRGSGIAGVPERYGKVQRVSLGFHIWLYSQHGWAIRGPAWRPTAKSAARLVARWEAGRG